MSDDETEDQQQSFCERISWHMSLWQFISDQVRTLN